MHPSWGIQHHSTEVVNFLQSFCTYEKGHLCISNERPLLSELSVRKSAGHRPLVPD